MKTHLVTVLMSALAFFTLLAGHVNAEEMAVEKSAAKLLMRLPNDHNTPDGATLDAQGNIILSIPNFNNDALLKEEKIEKASPPRMVMIDAPSDPTAIFTSRTCRYSGTATTSRAFYGLT
jgi:hypothetical protein